MTDAVVRRAGVCGVAFFVVLGIGFSPRSAPLAVLLGLGVVLTALFAAWRRLAGWPFAAVAMVIVAGVTALSSVNPASLGWMSLCVLAGWIALTSELSVVVAVAALVEVVVLLQWSLDRSEPGWAAWAAGTVFTVVACTFARRLRQTVEELERAQHQLAERTRAEERGRIAGEVHDVIGHALTVSLLHIGSARLALEESREEADQALDEAETLTRRSLDEVRATVGLMRTDASGQVAPLPSAADVPALVESFRGAGAAVDLEIDGDLTALGSARALVAYRIIQESLTNATKHAPGEPVTVDLRVGPDLTSLRVDNPAPTSGAATEGAGLHGMRQRAEGVGGTLTAGLTAKTWQVTAEWPT